MQMMDSVKNDELTNAGLDPDDYDVSYTDDYLKNNPHIVYYSID